MTRRRSSRRLKTDGRQCAALAAQAWEGHEGLLALGYFLMPSTRFWLRADGKMTARLSYRHPKSRVEGVVSGIVVVVRDLEVEERP